MKFLKNALLKKCFPSAFQMHSVNSNSTLDYSSDITALYEYIDILTKKQEVLEQTLESIIKFTGYKNPDDLAASTAKLPNMKREIEKKISIFSKPSLNQSEKLETPRKMDSSKKDELSQFKNKSLTDIQMLSDLDDLQESQNYIKASEMMVDIKVLENKGKRKKTPPKMKSETECKIRSNHFSNCSNENINDFPTTLRRIDKPFTCEQEKNIISNLLKIEGMEDFQLQGKEKQVKFIISANWWRNWVKYIHTEESAYFPGQMYNKKLIAKPILDPRRPFLKENILEHHDYEAVSKQIFRRLKNWYGCDYEIVRFVKKNDFLDELDVELYPEKKSLKNYNYDGPLLTNNSITTSGVNKSSIISSKQYDPITLNTESNQLYEKTSNTENACSIF